MLSLRRVGCWFLAFGFAAIGLMRPAAAADVLYAAPAAGDVRSQSLEWVAARKAGDQAVLDAVGRRWSDLSENAAPREVFEAVIDTFCLADAETKAFVDACRVQPAPLQAPEAAVLDRQDAGEFYVANVRLFYGRYLVQRMMYDEALPVFAALDPKAVVDPASCLFYQAVCQHELLMKTEGLATIEKLLKNTEQVPVSYASVATLMQVELQNLQEDTLDEVARMMRDVERRLDLGHGGQKVQKREYEVIATLDEIIEKLEAQGGS